MDTLFPLLSPNELLLAALVALVAGFVKGVVGFAMPMIFISGLTVFMSPELALAGLIVPTLATNLFQALRQGVPAAVRSTVDFRVFLCVGFVALVVSAQFVRVFPSHVLLGLIGVLITFFVVLDLSGLKFKLSKRSPKVEAIAGVVAGGMGGLSGVWGPPTVAYLTALNTAKLDQMRVQGVIYGLGAIALLGAHIGSGVLRMETISFSLVMLPIALIGVRVGMIVMDRIDQVMFRRATLCVLLVVGLNLIRRAWFG
ncbi:MAG: sulfite exporter TauE/SafE family protein [Sulfitobacter sp.]